MPKLLIAILLLFAVSVGAQLPPPDSRIPPNFAPNPQKPAARPLPPAVPTAFMGDVHVPKAGAEWKHIVRRLPPNRLNPLSLTVWIQNVTHPISDGMGLHLKNGEKYDPRNLRITTHYISFDAPAGDYILWRVGGTQLPDGVTEQMVLAKAKKK